MHIIHLNALHPVSDFLFVCLCVCVCVCVCMKVDYNSIISL